MLSQGISILTASGIDVLKWPICLTRYLILLGSINRSLFSERSAPRISFLNLPSLWQKWTWLWINVLYAKCRLSACWPHYNDVIMSPIASQITSLTIVYSTVYSGVHQRKHQSSASLDFVRGIHRSPVNSPHKGPVTRKIFPFDDVIMIKFSYCSSGMSHYRSHCAPMNMDFHLFVQSEL